MKRYSGQKALYEAMSKSRAKSKRPSFLQRLRPQLSRLIKPAAEKPKPQLNVSPPTAEKPVPTVLKPFRRPERPDPATAPGPAKTWLKPKAIQINAGRVEVSLPYQVGIAIALGLLLLLLVSFRLGQIDQKARYAKGQSSRSPRSAVGSQPAASSGQDATMRSSAAPSGALDVPATAPVRGDHWIVLTHYKRQADLEPVKAHFASYGIETAIVQLEQVRQYFVNRGLNVDLLPSGNGYLLVTRNLYANPGKAGSDGNAAREKIIEVGALYKDKAPQGYESFAPNYFSDAYGMKVE